MASSCTLFELCKSQKLRYPQFIAGCRCHSDADKFGLHVADCHGGYALEEVVGWAVWRGYLPVPIYVASIRWQHSSTKRQRMLAIWTGTSKCSHQMARACLSLGMLVSSRINGQLLVVVFAQFAGTSLWFAGNAILPELQPLLKTSELTSWLTSAVQIGFIVGTLLYALFAIPDRFRSTYVFLVSVALAATVNIIWLFVPIKAGTILASRFMTGFFLAGVYPVGMKIAADRFKSILGRAMGFLVGALVLGTAFPYLIRGMGGSLPYHTLMLSVSVLAISGGILLVAVVPAKAIPFGGNFFRYQTLLSLGKPSAYRPAMLGYFGHMWELYTFWAFLPILIIYYKQHHPGLELTNSLWTFGAIAAGAIGCIGGGYVALRIGSRQVARCLLLISGLCIVLLPWFLTLPPRWFGLFLLVWGASAAGDSPQFSTLVASRAAGDNRGSILTLVTCFGFLLTVLSIQFMAWLVAHVGISGWLFYVLLPGPLFGLWAMRQMDKSA